MNSKEYKPSHVGYRGKVLLNNTVKSHMIKIGGKRFYCECGCNCFHKPDLEDEFIYKCNACNSVYKGE